MERRYFIINNSSDYKQTSLHCCIGFSSTQRCSLDGTQWIIKTTQDIIDLNGLDTSKMGTEYTEVNILIELKKPTWTDLEII